MSTDTVPAQADLLSYFSRYIIAPLWARKEQSPYLKHLTQLIKRPYRPIQEVRAEQRKMLAALLKHASETSPYYTEQLAAANLPAWDDLTLEDLSRIPVLGKEDIREHQSSMLSTVFERDSLIQMKTSGSTGIALELFMDEDSQQWKRACAVRHNMWAGWRLGERIGAIWGNPSFYSENWRNKLRNVLLDRMLFLDTLKMDEEAMLTFHEELMRLRPTMMFGHAHSLYLFANFMKERGLPCVQPKGIVSTAMVLHDFEREGIEEVFNAKVFNRYGCEEVSLIASECSAHEGLHINMDTLIVECVRPDGAPAQNDEPGAVVVTDLTNYAMPMIRYKIGDVAKLKHKPCSCGITYPLIESLQGRIADYVRTPSGQFISGISLTENFAMELPAVKQMQLVQDRIDHLRIRVVRGENWTESVTGDIANLVNQRFDGEITHDVEFVDHIAPEASGKYRFCISLLEESPY